MKGRRLKKPNICVVCGTPFYPWRKTQECCSTPCSNKKNGQLTAAKGERKCESCGIVKPKEQFSRPQKNRSIRNRNCISCKKNALQQKKAALPWYHKKITQIICNCRNRAAALGIEFSLTKEDIVIPEKCPVFGTNFQEAAKKPGHFKSFAPSIDRIDNTKGYTKDNIVVVSLRANILKNDATPEELMQVATFYERLQNQEQHHT